MRSIVLVVDDDPVSVQLLEMMLARQGYEVIIAGNGAAGLKRAAEVRPNVVIADDMMPGMTGGDMCRALKDNPDLRHIPVILMSAGVRVQNAAYVQKVGADKVLVKPILPREVLKALESVLGKPN